MLVASVVLITPFFIPSAKMTPTFSEGATIWAIRSDGESVQRNDLVVIQRPDASQQPSSHSSRGEATVRRTHLRDMDRVGGSP